MSMTSEETVAARDKDTALNIRATPSAAPLGAEIQGVDLSQPLNDEIFKRILELFHEHQVICFRDQNMGPEQLVAFSARFGELDIHHMTEHVLPHLPQVRILSNAKKDGRAAGITRGGMHWHSDLSYQAVPALSTLLYGVVCPPEGADTQFASTYTAYEALSPELQQFLLGKRAVHDRNFRYSELYPNRPPLTVEQIAHVPPVEHPVVRVHPETGRKALYIAKDLVSGIVGLDDAESRNLIDQLESEATRPDRVYSHRWQEGDLVVWDNRCCLHRATPYDNKFTRTLYRTQVKGEVPIPA